jgi:NAD(P)-dependent dehydrogenase (short-subunit alcohol dehydrogenase family)
MQYGPFSLYGKKALVTGGGTGLGLGITEALVKAGAQVIIAGRRECILQEVSQNSGGNVAFEHFDVTKRSQAPAFVTRLEEKHGPVDILVNNAGQHLKKTVFETTDEEFDNVLTTNLLSVFTLTREFIVRMKERRSGSIVMISSMTGLFGMDKVVAYGTSKTALIGMMHQLVMDCSNYGIRINSIAPGWIRSDMLEMALNADKERKEKVLGRIPFKDFGEAEDIGNAVVYLSSPAAKYVTGVTLPVDGGAAFAF